MAGDPSLLAQITDESLGIRSEKCKGYGLRRAARAVLSDSRGRIALMNVSRWKYHKLPGGGLEEGETIAGALKREILEEAGCGAKIGASIGTIVEVRARFKLV